MKALDKILQFVGGAFVKDAADIVDRFVTTKEDKAEIKMALMQMAHKNEMETQKLVLQAEVEFNTRIKDLEGTSKDLIQAGSLGRFVLFLRGAQRPLWGYGVLFLDIMVFAGEFEVPADSALEQTFFIVNLLVLGFLFGERAVRNIAPLVKNLYGKKLGIVASASVAEPAKG